ncbi:MAG: tyrosine-type recombinase/integrase [archaeon]
MDYIYKFRREAIRRNLSNWTIKSYEFYINDFFKKCRKDPVGITKKDVKDYLEELSFSASPSTVNLAYCAMKTFVSDILNRNWNWQMKHSKKPARIPTYLTKQEMSRMLEIITNKTHYLLIALMYSSGLRLSEVINLEVSDFNFDKETGYVRQGKGRKDRAFIIAKKLQPLLKEYMAEKEGYVFSGRYGKVHRKTVYSIVKHYSKKAGISKNIHPHTLRHSFATHLAQEGYPLYTIQPLLGHTDPKTTQVYIHAAAPGTKVISPLDTLDSLTPGL